MDFLSGRAAIFTEVGGSVGGPLFRFAYQTFFEYVLASAVVRRTDSLESLARALLRYTSVPGWPNVASLAVQLIDKAQFDGAAKTIECILNDTTDSGDTFDVDRSSMLSQILTMTKLPPSLVRRVRDLIDSGSDPSGVSRWR